MYTFFFLNQFHVFSFMFKGLKNGFKNQVFGHIKKLLRILYKYRSLSFYQRLNSHIREC